MAQPTDLLFVLIKLANLQNIWAKQRVCTHPIYGISKGQHALIGILTVMSQPTNASKIVITNLQNIWVKQRVCTHSVIRV